MKKIIYFLVLSLFFVACEEDKVNIPQSLTDQSDITVTLDMQRFHAFGNDRNSDDFDIRNVHRDGDVIEILVQYGGGCEPHDFEIIWNNEVEELESGHNGYNIIELFLLHNANGDLCEAALRDTLYISLNDLDPSVNWDQYAVRIQNGSKEQDVVAINFMEPVWESETCLIEVEAERVICGDGLIENLWFKYAEDEFGNGIYLQPASIAAFILLDPNIPEGEKYKMGVKVSTWDPNPDTGVCAAFPGYSVPVDIYCIESVE